MHLLALAALLNLAPVDGAMPAEVAAASALPDTAELDAAEARDVIGSLAIQLEQNFVDPEVGLQYAKMLRAGLDNGRYAVAASREELAEAVTADLQAVNRDGHLRLYAPERPGVKSRYRLAPAAEGAIGKSGWIGRGIAYVELNMFPGDAGTIEKLRAILDAHADAKTLIVDLRGHHGGDIAEIDLIASYLFSSTVELARMDTRAAVEERGQGVFTDGPTLLRIDGPAGVVRRSHVVIPRKEASGLTSARVFVLTSRRTVSAAEHLAMALKRTGRATLVGETSWGAGNYGDPYPLPHGFRAFIPSGRSFDPDTGLGWEGTGVAPDVAVASDQALEEALRLAGADVQGGIAAAAGLR